MESADDFIARKSLQWEAERDHPSISTKDIGRQGANTWVREAWTLLAQHNHTEKVLVVERLRRDVVMGVRANLGGAALGDIEYRFGYFIVGRIGRAAGRWTWGQFSPLIPGRGLAGPAGQGPTRGHATAMTGAR